MPVAFAGIELDPLSNDFVSPSPGVLQYTGATAKRFEVGASLSFFWVTAGATTRTTFIMRLLHNDESLGETGTGGTLTTTSGPEAFGRSVQTMLQLNPGDTLQIALGALDNDTYTLVVSALLLNAHEV